MAHGTEGKKNNGRRHFTPGVFDQCTVVRTRSRLVGPSLLLAGGLSGSDDYRYRVLSKPKLSHRARHSRYFGLRENGAGGKRRIYSDPGAGSLISFAFVEELPGANSQGDMLEEARSNLREAVQLVLEANRSIAKEALGDTSVIREPLAQIS